VPPPAPAPELPRAAAIVKEGKSQAEIDLEGKLAEAQKTIKDRDLSLMDLQDQHHQFKQLNRPTPKPKKKSALEAFFDGED
jgi:uncharacterized protein (DUF1778 family)